MCSWLDQHQDIICSSQGIYGVINVVHTTQSLPLLMNLLERGKELALWRGFGCLLVAPLEIILPI